MVGAAWSESRGRESYRYNLLTGRIGKTLPDQGGSVAQSAGFGTTGLARVRDGVYNRPMLISLGTGSVEPATGEDFVAESEPSGFDHLSRFRNESPS